LELLLLLLPLLLLLLLLPLLLLLESIPADVTLPSRQPLPSSVAPQLSTKLQPEEANLTPMFAQEA
jgi:hypothetical protein